ncbi:uncharacterized protein LOC103709157 [Phoenix dactylifera]|uniref:Uncharacterized protein LOC103709157 n=1 Tax=Phoenix dactylifera TaxID=42345 RepID=A0A8B7C6D2_PHODC|nr:uncharacterized protein LOC103709157 [Phoenix dactylifera]
MMGKGGDDGFRTVERLRGRLQAERVASKAAKEQADSMAKRLEELERKLAEEMKCRNRAEKRLENALKKLESLKILDSPGSSASSSSSHCFSGHLKLESWGLGSPTVDWGQCGWQEEAPRLLGDDVSGSSLVVSTHRRERSWSSAGTAPSDLHKGESHGDESSRGGSPRVSIADNARKSSVSDNKLDDDENQTEEVDNALALVPVSLRCNLEGCKPEINNNVQSVLIALRHVKDQLQYSMRRTGVFSPKELYGR